MACSRGGYSSTEPPKKDNQLVTNCHRLKMLAEDGRLWLTGMATSLAFGYICAGAIQIPLAHNKNAT